MCGLWQEAPAAGMADAVKKKKKKDKGNEGEERTGQKRRDRAGAEEGEGAGSGGGDRDGMAVTGGEKRRKTDTHGKAERRRGDAEEGGSAAERYGC